ncbi:MAG: DUF1177 domain-containing protein [Liquorilactobacillus nagelii]|uniref:DUF1177 domain-containing protein n=1 Tax=Liquorilactobacillus nagelii TaxID=82688 RepID=UPI0039EB1C24
MLKQVLEIEELLDARFITGFKVKQFFAKFSFIKVGVSTVKGVKGSTDFVRIVVPGTHGKSNGGQAPTLGVIGRLGGIGARPSRIGIVSDSDGAVAALSLAYKLSVMHEKGDVLAGDVIIATHICPDAPTQPHQPVDFMDSPVTMYQMNQYEISTEMDAVLTIDTTKGNQIINHKGVSISPTVKEGYILKVSYDLIRLAEVVTGKLASTFPITMQDITPYGNGLYHLNSILQPAVATKAPVVGVAITTVSMVPGCSTGASHEPDIADAANFSLEVAKEFTAQKISFYDQAEFKQIVKLYGPMNKLQTFGNEKVTD